MESESSIEVLAPYESRSYVDMTVDAMQQFGVKVASRARKNGSVMYRVAAPQRYTASDFAVEGDYSQAAFLAVLGCAVGGINVVGLNPDSQQGDKVILDILKRCGGKFKLLNRLTEDIFFAEAQLVDHGDDTVVNAFLAVIAGIAGGGVCRVF